MARKEKLSWEDKFFSWLEKSAGGKFLRKHINLSGPERENPYAGRIMVPLYRERGIGPPHTFPEFYLKEVDAWRMFYLANERPSEVSSLMSVDWSCDRIAFRSQIFPRQFCSTIKSDIDPKWVADYSRDISLQEEKAIFNCNFWMHSHMSKNMARWSNYDDLSIGRMAKGKKLLISVVVVPPDETLRYRCRIDIGEPFNLTIDDIPIFVMKDHLVDHKAIKREMDKEYKEKVIIVENSLFLYDRDDGYVFSDDPDLVFGDDPDSGADKLRLSDKERNKDD